MVDHVNWVCSSAHYYLRQLKRFQRILPRTLWLQLVYSMVLSRPYYGNAFLLGISSGLLYKVQRIQNAAAKFVIEASYHDHATPPLRCRHWLPIRQRIAFEMVILVFYCLHGMYPPYLSDHFTVSCKGLRTDGDLNMPPKRRSTAGDQAFAKVAP